MTTRREKAGPSIENLPAGDLIGRGLADLERGVDSEESLLIRIGAPRLRRGGIAVPDGGPDEPERALYDRLYERLGDGAHSAYNALVRQLVSFERALECANR